jgi:HPt (histidine-containing phosphotransfer) domain-containing protein
MKGKNMHPLLTELKNKCSVNVSNTLDRFGDAEKLYITFLFRFPKDENYHNLLRQAEIGIYDENSIYYAHGFKGVTGNLGMTLLFETFKEIESCIENENFNPIPEKLKSVEENYNSIVDTINKFK